MFPRLRLAAILVLLTATPVWSFDYARYKPADLDELLAGQRPQSGADIHGLPPWRLLVTLAAHAEPCDTGFMKRALIASGIPKSTLEGTPVTRCINVRSAKGAVVSLFLQDQLAALLLRDVRLGGRLTVYALHVFTSRDGPGLLVTAFGSGHDVDPNRVAASPSQPAADAPDCTCGPADEHLGADYTAPEGTPVSVAAAGVVVKVETDENAVVEAPTAGMCGRYVVIQHSHRDGRAAFTRYAQLGRLVGKDGQPIKAGMLVTKDDKIGEVGSRKTLHFEVRLLDRATMESSPDWVRRYGSDPSMQWSGHKPVDPAKFDFEGFGTPAARR